MSSSCHKTVFPRALARACVLTLACGSPAGEVLAAETYVQPQLDLRLVWNDNWDLSPQASADSEVYGYVVDAQALVGRATPRSDTSLQPRVVLREYPDREEIMKRVEAFVDLKSRYGWLNSELALIARYSRQDMFTVVRPDADFNELDPNNPEIPDSARRLVGVSRDRFEIYPGFTHRISERVRAGVTAGYETSRYDTDLQQDYEYLRGEGFLGWAADPRNEVNLGAYVSEFDVMDGSSDTAAYGVSASWARRLSEISGMDLRLFYESNDVTNHLPVETSETSKGMGGSLTAYFNGPTSQWRFTAESGFYPTGDGGKIESDQLRVQYRRDLSERLQFNAAARYLRGRAIGTADDTDDRDYARLELSMRWRISPRWRISGGYNFMWQEYQVEGDSAKNNEIFLGFGYRGLGRQG